MMNNTSIDSAGNDWQRSRLLENGFFLLIILIEAGIAFYLILGRWIVGGHDGFQYFTLQYYFLNNVVNAGEIPQWMPFLTHGTVAAWWHIISGGILQNIMLLSGSLFKGINFLPLFHIGIFIEQLLLLTGVWLLGRRFFASPFTLFFVALSIMGSCIWMLQPWWNFHLYYAVPLILHFLHRFLDSGKWRYCFLAGNLLFMQSLGNLPYFLPLTSLVIALYFLFYAVSNYKAVRTQIQNIKFSRSFVLAAIVTIVPFIALYVAMHFGTDQIKSYTFRSPDGSSPLDVFLSYGGQSSWKMWLELLSGVSPGLDYTLYIGIISVPLVIVGLFFNLNRHNIHFLLTAIVLLLFSAGTFVSIVLYHCWPMMKYFRHLMLVAPVIKILLCFLAGFGFDALFFSQSRWKKPLIIKTALTVISIFMMGVAFSLWWLSGNCELAVYFFDNMVPEKLFRFLSLSDEGLMSFLLVRTAFYAFTAAVLFAVYLSFTGRKQYFITLAGIVLVMHGVDIYGFKYSEIKSKAVPLNKAEYKIAEFQTMPYATRRDIAFKKYNIRKKMLNVLPIKYGAFYWTTHAMLFKDQLGNPFKTDHLLSPLDHYMKAYWGQPVNDYKPRGLVCFSHLEFPRTHPAALKISGVTENKIQFFSQAKVVSSDDVMTDNITSPDYKGDILFLSPLINDKKTSGVSQPEFSKQDLSANKRLRLSYQVKRFDSNNLEITTRTNDSESTWMMYSDVWHPFWRATVNGKNVPVYKANLAYKAIKLEKGFNEVHFYFKSELLSAIYFFFGLNALLWLGIIVFLSVTITLRHSGQTCPGHDPMTWNSSRS